MPETFVSKHFYVILETDERIILFDSIPVRKAVINPQEDRKDGEYRIEADTGKDEKSMGKISFPIFLDLFHLIELPPSSN